MLSRKFKIFALLFFMVFVAYSYYVRTKIGYYVRTQIVLKKSENDPHPLVGQTFHDFNFPARGDSAISILEVASANRVTLINIWASWCPPCRAEMPGLVKVYQTYADSGFALISINVDQDQTMLDAYLASNPLPFPIALDPDGRILDYYQFQAIPMSLYLNRRGIIIEVITGASSFTWRTHYWLDTLSTSVDSTNTSEADFDDDE